MKACSTRKPINIIEFNALKNTSMIALFVIMWVLVFAYSIDEQDDKIEELEKKIEEIESKLDE